MQSRLGRWILVVLLVSQVGTIAGLLVLSRHEGNQKVEDQARSVLQSNADDAQRRLEAHLFPAETLLRYSSGFLSYDSGDAGQLEGTFRQGLDDVSQLAGAFVGDEHGNFFYVNRTPEGVRVKTIDNGPTRTVGVVYYGPTGSFLSEEDLSNDRYDPRERPWYELAAEADAGQASWTDPYIFFTSQEIGITVAQPIVTNGAVVGVVGVDMELASLTTFLENLRPADAGLAIMYDPEAGTVLARSSDVLAFEQTEDGQELLPASGTALGDALRLRGQPTDQLIEFISDSGQTVHAAFRSVDVGSKSWTIAVLGEESEIVSSLARAEQREQRLQLLVGALAVLATAAVAIPLLRPVEKLEREAGTDVLTELPNRRSILAAASSLSASSSPHAIAMIDIDSFKQINDRFGHAVGDEVLRTVAGRLRDALRSGDRIGRIGGEEFVALIRSKPAEAKRTATAMLEAVRDTSVETSVGEVFVTVSIGLAAAPEMSDEVWLLAEADRALMQAKEEGRDRLGLHESIGADESPEVRA